MSIDKAKELVEVIATNNRGMQGASVMTFKGVNELQNSLSVMPEEAFDKMCDNDCQSLGLKSRYP